MSEYLSVSQYATLHHKDAGNIRRMLISGRLNGIKVGNQWIIPSDTPFPRDKRVTTGQYKNWRQKTAFAKHKDLSRVISSMLWDLREIYGDTLFQALLYGSYARGEQTEESDVDIALLLNGTPTKAMTDAMVCCVSSYELRCNKVLSVIEIDNAQFLRWQNTMPFYQNIRKEGIILWKAVA